MNIHLTAIVKGKSAHIPKLKAILEDMVLQSRREKACIQYELHQGTDDPHVFAFHEIWESAEALEIHDQQPYITAFVAQVPELVESVEIYRMQLL